MDDENTPKHMSGYTLFLWSLLPSVMIVGYLAAGMFFLRSVSITIFFFPMVAIVVVAPFYLYRIAVGWKQEDSTESESSTDKQRSPLLLAIAMFFINAFITFGAQPYSFGGRYNFILESRLVDAWLIHRKRDQSGRSPARFLT